MLPVYNSSELKSWDQFTIEHQKIRSIDLMERAAVQFANWFTGKFTKEQTVIVFCGNGNNGGDGLAISRLLKLKNYNVHLVLIKVAQKNSTDFDINLGEIEKLDIGQFGTTQQVQDFLAQTDHAIIVDAILGYGLNRETSLELREWFRIINESGCLVTSVDIPSGLYADKPTPSICVHAKYTYTFQNPKLCHLIPDSGMYCGFLEIGSIGLASEFISQYPPALIYTEQIDIKMMYKARNPFDHKNKFGHLLMVGGSRGMAGAVILAAKAGLMTGSGLCSIYSEECNREIIQLSLPEAIYMEHYMEDPRYSCIVIGPGLGTSITSKERLSSLLLSDGSPIVLDADALNIIAKEMWLHRISKNCILTPHVGEFDRLFGKCTNGFERLEKAIQKSAELGIYIILKGKYTAIVCPDKKVYFNSTGNPGLAKGGSGDVLSGMLGSFLAQGYTRTEACIMAVYMHGLAADIATEHIAMESLMATEIIHNISNAFHKITM